jgi:hypothetical protein
MMSASPASWPCEQNVVESVASYLRAEGWTIESIADTEARSPGADIRAVRSSELLIVEAKGYPATVYARGENKGKPKPTRPGVQARHWYGQVLFDAILRQSQFPSATVMIALPDFPLFRNLISRTEHALRKLDISVFLVCDNCSVKKLI